MRSIATTWNFFGVRPFAVRCCPASKSWKSPKSYTHKGENVYIYENSFAAFQRKYSLFILQKYAILAERRTEIKPLKWQMGFNSPFKDLSSVRRFVHIAYFCKK